LKLKENFSNLLAKKIKNIHRTINNSGKAKPKFIGSSDIHIININSILRNIKSDVMADFVQTDQHGIIITMNKVTLPSDLQTIENYVKNIDYIDFSDCYISLNPNPI